MCRILNDFGSGSPKMGRHYFDAKTTVEETKKLSISKLKELGYLRESCEATLTWMRKATGEQDSIGITVNLKDEPYVRLNYTTTHRITGEKIHYDYKINLTVTPCKFGGIRYWFVCPSSIDGSRCGRRVPQHIRQDQAYW
jgi:hypothetical protein